MAIASQRVDLSIKQLRKHGISLHKSGNVKEAVRVYNKYLGRVNNDAGIWTNLGCAYRKLGLFQSAINCQMRALRINPEDSIVLSNLSNVLRDTDRLEDALNMSRLSTVLAPESEPAWFNYALSLRECKEYSECLVALDHCERIATKPSPKYDWERALCHLNMGDFKKGWNLYESRRSNNLLPVRPAFPEIWNGQNLFRKKLLLYAEQGFGDTIWASRFIPHVQKLGADITLECRGPLHRLFSKLDIRIKESNTPIEYSDQYDYQCSLMSLPGQLSIDRENIPPPARLWFPIKTPLESRVRDMSKSFNIGIVWSGSETFADNRRRSPGLELFLSLSELPGVQLFSLQKGPREKDLQKFGADSYIVDLSNGLTDFAETAAAIKALDLIVMSDSSVAHLAGSLGKPIINLLQYRPYWLYALELYSSPWYPTMKLIRQATPGEWEPAFAELKVQIQKYAEEKKGNK